MGSVQWFDRFLPTFRTEAEGSHMIALCNSRCETRMTEGDFLDVLSKYGGGRGSMTQEVSVPEQRLQDLVRQVRR